MKVVYEGDGTFLRVSKALCQIRGPIAFLPLFSSELSFNPAELAYNPYERKSVRFPASKIVSKIPWVGVSLHFSEFHGHVLPEGRKSTLAWMSEEGESLLFLIRGVSPKGNADGLSNLHVDDFWGHHRNSWSKWPQLQSTCRASWGLIQKHFVLGTHTRAGKEGRKGWAGYLSLRGPLGWGS